MWFKALEIELHPYNINIEGGFCRSKSWKPLNSSLNFSRHDPRTFADAVPNSQPVCNQTSPTLLPKIGTSFVLWPFTIPRHYLLSPLLSASSILNSILASFLTWYFFPAGVGCYIRLALFLVHQFLSLWWSWCYVPPKRRFLQKLHAVISQKTPFFIVTAVKTSNLT
jgi:hypothetical protein